MVRNYIRRLKAASFKPNVVIILVSLVLSLVFFYLACVTDGMLRDFIINLSASVLIVAFTVLLVDMLRERSLAKQYAVPRSVALQKIFGCNSLLALNLAIRNYKSKNNLDILKNLMQYINTNKDTTSVLNEGAEGAFRQLARLSSDGILRGYSDRDLESELKKSLQNIRDIYTDTSNKYGFSFNDIVLKSDFAELIEKLDGALQAITVVGIGDQELQNLFRPIDPKKPGKPMTTDAFVGILVLGYIQCYVSFIDKYKSQIKQPAPKQDQESKIAS